MNNKILPILPVMCAITSIFTRLADTFIQSDLQKEDNIQLQHNEELRVHNANIKFAVF